MHNFYNDFTLGFNNLINFLVRLFTKKTFLLCTALADVDETESKKKKNEFSYALKKIRYATRFMKVKDDKQFSKPQVQQGLPKVQINYKNSTKNDEI